jgi:hypothetical protein
MSMSPAHVLRYGPPLVALWVALLFSSAALGGPSMPKAVLGVGVESA